MKLFAKKIINNMPPNNLITAPQLQRMRQTIRTKKLSLQA